MAACVGQQAQTGKPVSRGAGSCPRAPGAPREPPGAVRPVFSCARLALTLCATGARGRWGSGAAVAVVCVATCLLPVFFLSGAGGGLPTCTAAPRVPCAVPLTCPTWCVCPVLSAQNSSQALGSGPAAVCVPGADRGPGPSAARRAPCCWSCPQPCFSPWWPSCSSLVVWPPGLPSTLARDLASALPLLRNRVGTRLVWAPALESCPSPPAGIRPAVGWFSEADAEVEFGGMAPGKWTEGFGHPLPKVSRPTLKESRAASPPCPTFHSLEAPQKGLRVRGVAQQPFLPLPSTMRSVTVSSTSSIPRMRRGWASPSERLVGTTWPGLEGGRGAGRASLPIPCVWSGPWLEVGSTPGGRGRGQE